MQNSFWITNISNRNVVVADLNLTINAWSSVNLLDAKHYSYSLIELQKSASNGSLSKKKDKLVVRKVPPPVINKTQININYDEYIPCRGHSIHKINQEVYEELNVSDEEFAKENADLA